MDHSGLLKYAVREINDLDLFHDATKALNKSSMRRIVLNVVISIFDILKLDDKRVRNAVLFSSSRKKVISKGSLTVR